MNIVNIHEAKTHLSKLVEKAAQGEPFIIAKLASHGEVVAMDAPIGKKIKRRVFWPADQSADNFDTMFSRRSKMFDGKMKLLFDTHLLLWTVENSPRCLKAAIK